MKLEIYKSNNACYAFTRVAVPLAFNSAKHYLGFTSIARSDVIIVKYSFYEHKGLYWYAITVDEGHVMNSLFFVSLANCVRDFRSLCHAMDWKLADSSGLANFCALYVKDDDKERWE